MNDRVNLHCSVWTLSRRSAPLRLDFVQTEQCGVVCNCVDDVVENNRDDVIKALLSTTSTQMQRL
jgi:hypothetical protein